MKFQRENVAYAWDALVALARAHHTEHKVPWPFDPQRAVYESWERAGLLWLFTMRDESGGLQGYSAFTLIRHPHFNCMMASQDTLYVAPAARGYHAGRFFHYVDLEMVEAGAQQICRVVPLVQDWSGQLTRMGYTESAKLMIKRAQ